MTEKSFQTPTYIFVFTFSCTTSSIVILSMFSRLFLTAPSWSEKRCKVTTNFWTDKIFRSFFLKLFYQRFCRCPCAAAQKRVQSYAFCPFQPNILAIIFSLFFGVFAHYPMYQLFALWKFLCCKTYFYDSVFYSTSFLPNFSAFFLLFCMLQFVTI